MGKKKPTADKTVTFKVVQHSHVLPMTKAQAAGYAAAEKSSEDFVPSGDLLADVTRQMVNRLNAAWEAEARTWFAISTGKPFDEAAYLADRRDKLILAAHRREREQERWEWVSLYCPEVLRPVLEMHSPFADGCEGCDPGAYAEDAPVTPCSTALLVERLTVEAVDAAS